MIGPVKRLFKWAFRLVLIVAVLVGLAVVFKDAILHALTEDRIRSETGMGVRIGHYSSGVFPPRVTIKDLKLYNPPEFGGGIFAEVPILHLECDSAALTQRRLRLQVLEIDLAQVVIVRNQAGHTNIVSMLHHVKKKQAERKKKRQQSDDFEFDGIDHLDLSLGTARFIDLKNPQRNREMRIELDHQVVKNLRSEGDFYGLMLLLWLRSGGKLGVPPADFTREYLEDRVGNKPVRSSP